MKYEIYVQYCNLIDRPSLVWDFLKQAEMNVFRITVDVIKIVVMSVIRSKKEIRIFELAIVTNRRNTH